jgi:hypothetical protein
LGFGNAVELVNQQSKTSFRELTLEEHNALRSQQMQYQQVRVDQPFAMHNQFSGPSM